MHLSGGDGLADALATLAAVEADLLVGRGLGDGLIGLDEDHLDVARVGHVRVDLIEVRKRQGDGRGK